MSLSLDFIHHIRSLQETYRGTSPDRLLLGKGSLSREERTALALQLTAEPTLHKKLPSWHTAGVFLPSSLTLEQCSSEEAARYKARFASPSDRLLDLTGGFGVDFWALASVTGEGVYVERQADLVASARANLPRLLPSARLTLLHGESLPLLPELIATHRPTLIYLDPARREGADTTRRVYAIEDCEPNLHTLLPELTALYRTLDTPLPRLVVKLSPMLDVVHTLRSVAGVQELHIVSVRGEAKELLLLIDLNRCSEEAQPEAVTFVAQDLHPTHPTPAFVLPEALAEEERAVLSYTAQPRAYLLEPHAALMKTGLFRSIGAVYHLEGLHPNSHLYTTDTLPEASFPGRVFAVDAVYPFASSQLKTLGKTIGAAQITCRNFPLRPEALRAKLRIKDSAAQTLFGTTTAEGEHVLLLCRRL